jgi:molecular chaperone DnaK
VQTSMTSLTDTQQTGLKTLIEQLKMAVNGDDKAAIEMRQKALQDAYSNIMQAEQSQAGHQQGNAAKDSANDDVIDADFEDVSNG